MDTLWTDAPDTTRGSHKRKRDEISDDVAQPVWKYVASSLQVRIFWESATDDARQRVRLPAFVPFASTLNAFWTGEEETELIVPRPIGQRIEPAHARGDTVQIGFGGCGGFYNYHLGIASVLQEHFDLTNCVFSGASAGCFPALVLALGLDVKSFFYGPNLTLVKDANEKTFYGLRDWIPLTKQHVLATLPPDAYARVDKKFFISITHVPSLANELVTTWESNEDMVECILASGHVPIYTNEVVKPYRGASYVDGCVSNNWPLPHGDEHPSKVFQIYHWRTVWPHWVLISTNTDWAQTQFAWGREDALKHIHEIEAVLHYKQSA
ncbi:Patatin like protein [Achlya hypogyna]|uniref:Patatin like protein n=1 Tax=Achlya hypogyna TaxID=1202772 RepID=A0A1V9YNX6_ACHHY|nr:Patatin like protein [Achlya hypogyna]